ncbi:MAG: HAMP domain-containing protein, partial [Nitrospiraceae bacterium]
MRIRSKLNIAFLVIVCLLMAVGAVAILYLSRVGDISTSIYDNDLIPIHTLSEIDSLLNEALIIASDHVMEIDGDLIKEMEQRSDRTFKSLYQKLGQLSDMQRGDPASAALIKGLREETPEFEKSLNRIFTLSRDFLKEDAARKLHETTESIYKKVRSQGNTLTTHLRNRASLNYETGRKVIADSTGIIGTVIAIGFILSLSIGLAISKAITAPVRKAAEFFGMLAKGNMQNKLTYAARDEVGDLARSFNIIVDVITDLTREVKRLTEAAAKGEFQAQGNEKKFHGEYAEIITGFNVTFGILRRASAGNERENWI